MGAIVVKSLNAGATWTPLTSDSRGAILAKQWGNVGNVAYTDLDVGQSVRFGVRVVRVGSGSADISDSRCNVRMVVYSRDGQASPF